MPELPEVHTTVTQLDPLLHNLSIVDIWSGYDSAHHRGKDNIKNVEYFLNEFKPLVINQQIVRVSRRAKNILITLSSGKIILIHMKMTGHLLYGKYRHGKEGWKATEPGPLQDPFNGWIRLVFSLSNGKHLALSDLRKFAKVTLIDSIKTTTHLEGIGPEPLDEDFDFEAFNQRITTRQRGKIKQVLMDQKIIAGIGNIYSDEALWLSSIHPKSVVASIGSKERKVLYKNIQTVLSKGISFGGDSTSDYRTPSGTPGEFQHHHNAYRRTKQKCLKRSCSGTIERTMVGGRSAHFCNTHQILYT